MIEFKAECGHTVRAKDDEVGDVIRCSYCGRQVAVPDNRDDNLDFLFSDIQQSGEPLDVRRPRKRGRVKRFLGSGRRSPGRFNPFAIILRMCYAALLLAIVIFVGDKYVLPLFRADSLSNRVDDRSGQPSAQKNATTKTEQRKPVRRRGLVTKSPPGLYVCSTPPGATAYCVEMSKAPSTGRIYEVRECIPLTRPNGDRSRVPNGVYVVEVVFPWNDPNLNDPDLPNYRQYRKFRRAIEHASDAERIQQLEDYFVPDDAWSVFIDQTDDQIYIVRQYWNVQVRGGRSKGVRALFLPKIVPPGRDSFSTAELVKHYLPREKAYGFDETHVRNELDFYDVPASDRSFVVEALLRIGVVPYVTRDKRIRLFKIDINDGAFSAKVIREATE